MPNRALLALVVAAALTSGYICLPRYLFAQTQGNSPTAKWQYGLLVFSSGEPVFTVARQSSSVQAPTGKPGGGGNTPAFNGADIHFTTRDVWSTEMLTLDALGDQGWEAFSSYTEGARTTIFLKKRLP